MEFGRRYQLRYFQPYCNESSDLLDFGCADGLSLRHLPAKRRVGVEINPIARKKCKELCSEVSYGVELHASLNSVKSESIDIVISNHSLEHVPNPLETLSELHRILRPRGRLILVVPIDDWRDPKNRSWRAGDPDHHLYTWCPLNLGNLLVEAGFGGVETKISTSAWNPRFFWVHRNLGRSAFNAVCYLFALYRRRREIIAVSIKGPIGSAHPLESL